MKTEDTILKHIKAGDWQCLANCRAHDYVILSQTGDHQGGLSFAVYVGDDRHRIKIRLNHVEEYDVSLTRLDGVIVDSGTYQGGELAEVITSICDREDTATTIMEAIHAADPWCLAKCAASEVTSLKA